ncbi:MAG: ATP-dependent sacrificial sulfur transferase LarE [Planctomycetota bacterium]|nr:MAG: ATP-dependent sacrificial sulfur transferase LarE [Planctomycetota bacterium]
MDKEVKAESKCQELLQILRGLGSVAIAYSGGVDSTFLVSAAREVLGENVVAVTARSETYSEEEGAEAACNAAAIGVEHIIIETSELGIPGFSDNPPDRCYHCKHELFIRVFQAAKERGLKHVLDGSNADDVDDFRPGMRAAAEMGVRQPLREAGLTKNDIRALSKKRGLPTWSKPAMACLASRFPYGEKITREKLSRVAEAERFVRDLGFHDVRVRSHGTIARIEIGSEQLTRVMEPDVRNQITAKLSALGFTYVTLDLQGFRSGSMNEVLDM